MIWVGVDVLTPELFLSFYDQCGLEQPCREQVSQALSHTLASFVIYEGNHPMGMCRMLGDNALRYCLQDLIVLPQSRNMGVGRRLMAEVERHIRSHLQPGWKATVEVVCDRKAESFYRQMGFTFQQHVGLLKNIFPEENPIE